MIIDPTQYESTSVRELLDAAEKGIVPLDHRLLHRLLDRPEGVLDEILAFVSDSGDEELMIEEELFAVFQHLRDPRCLPWVVGRLRRAPDDFAEEAVDLLRQFGPEAVPLLLEWFAEDGEAGFFLAAANPGDSRVLDALVAHLDMDASGAAFCLTVFGDPAAIPRIEQKLAATAEPEARQELEAALRELRERGPEPPPKPYNIWDDFPEEALPDFYAFKDEELIEFLASPEAAYRTGALEMLSRPRLERAHADKVLALAESDPEPAVRGKAWEVLGDRWEQRAIQSRILARLRDAEAPPVERAGALVAAAGPLGNRAEIQDLIQRFYDAEATRLQAMRAIVFSGEPKFAPVVLDNLLAADPSLVREAIQGVGSLQLAEGAPDLVPFFESHTDRVLALEAYAMSAPAQLTRKGMRQLLEKMERLAGGFEEAEQEAVTEALNLRLERADLEPLFDEKGEMIPAPLEIVRQKTGRNDACPCGSGKKYKKCCGA